MRRGCGESLNETGVTAVHATELLIAFRQDATKLRYETFDELLNYCRYSAVPVGRYVIDLHGENHDGYRRLRRAVHFVANTEPFAGLRAPTCGRWIVATFRKR